MSDLARKIRLGPGVAALVVLALSAGGCGEDAPAPERADRFDAERAFRDLRAQVEIGPRPAGSPGGRRVVELIAARLRAAGAEAVRLQRPWRNVVASIPGDEAGAIVLGAHHDTKDIPGLTGANDGASGVAVVLELARALAADGPLDGPTVHLALFDAEEARGERSFAEDGGRGSRQYVTYARAGGRQGSPPLEGIDAMVLFDLVGDCDLQIPREDNSDPGLYAEFARAALELTGSPAPFGDGRSGILDDHVRFLVAGVPAVDLIDFTYGPGPSPGTWWHTPEDTIDKVCPASLDAVGEAALLALPRLG